MLISLLPTKSPALLPGLGKLGQARATLALQPEKSLGVRSRLDGATGVSAHSGRSTNGVAVSVLTRAWRILIRLSLVGCRSLAPRPDRV